MSVPKLNLSKLSNPTEKEKEKDKQKEKEKDNAGRTSGRTSSRSQRGFKLNLNKVDQAASQAAPVTSPIGKLDLSKIQLPAKASTTRDGAPLENSRYRVRAFDTVCSKITEDLFLGSDTVAQNKDLLLSHGITHIVNCAGDVCGTYHPDTFTYKTMCLKDVGEEDISVHFQETCDFIDNAVKGGGKVFIHCQKGVSRSSAMTICYLIYTKGWEFDQAHNYIKNIRDVANPNPGFIIQLLGWYKQLKEKGKITWQLYTLKIVL